MILEIIYKDKVIMSVALEEYYQVAELKLAARLESKMNNKEFKELEIKFKQPEPKPVRVPKKISRKKYQDYPNVQPTAPIQRVKGEYSNLRLYDLLEG